jgi:3-dehydroquinate dehydratase-1
LQIDFVALGYHESVMRNGVSKETGKFKPAPTGRQNNHRILDNHRSCVVGIVDSRSALAASRRLTDGAIDFLEWRADFLGTGIVPASRPWIVTARHPLEGGQNAMSATARRAALFCLLPAAAIVDVEIRSLREMGEVVREARSGGIAVLASFHDFQRTPPLSRLWEIANRAADAGADFLKIATLTSSPADVARLLDLLEKKPLPLAVMGMGPLGMASRVVLATAGSILNYGWLHRPNVSGQWSALELARLLKTCQANSTAIPSATKRPSRVSAARPS